MIAGLRSWWDERSRREQRLLLVMFALVLLVMAWLLIVRPLADALETAKSRHAAAVLALAQARAQQGHAARDGGRPLPQPLEAWLTAQVNEAGFTGARIAREGPGRASLAIDAARPQAFFVLVRQLEEAGVRIESLRASANSDQSLAIAATFGTSG
ncbi:MAG: type II secretion system protein GspM [Sphingosinicella sp.]